MTLWRANQVGRSVAPLPPLQSPTPIGSAVEQFLRAWTEDLYVSGFISGWGRLSDALNQREPLRIEQARVHGLRSASWLPRPDGEMVIDPFDLELALGYAIVGSDAERAAKRIHKVRYPVLIEGQEFEVLGTMHVFPGNAPEYATHRSGLLFLPITEPSVRRRQRLVSDRYTDVALVNRYAIRRIRQLDSRPS
ncbi:MAG: hypothetical protein C0498_05035 [Anaerolinea sp.]|jgi:hypothetical protein|nr:hypothetical protein [Anaerolinea sp.]